MAEIKVEQKGPSIWPWIVGLIVLALLIWALMEMFGRDDTDTVTGPMTDTVVTEPYDTFETAPAADPFADTVAVDTFGIQP